MSTRMITLVYNMWSMRGIPCWVLFRVVTGWSHSRGLMNVSIDEGSSVSIKFSTCFPYQWTVFTTGCNLHGLLLKNASHFPDGMIAHPQILINKNTIHNITEIWCEVCRSKTSLSQLMMTQFYFGNNKHVYLHTVLCKSLCVKKCWRPKLA